MKRLHLFLPGGQVAVLDEAQTLDAGELLRGFSVKVGDFFVSENRVSS
jgi:hypothetical protein